MVGYQSDDSKFKSLHEKCLLSPFPTIFKAGCLGYRVPAMLKAQTKTAAAAARFHQGTLTFEDGVTSQEIAVTILTKGRYFGKETKRKNESLEGSL